MKKIYRIIPSPMAPELYLDEKLAGKINGQSLINLSPDKPFKGCVSSLGDWKQFYRVGDQAFAVSEEAWENCMEMYYAITENDIELLSVEASNVDLRVINPRQFLPASGMAASYCDLTYVNALFRIENRPPQELFCYEGMAVQANEFKYNYDKFGFQGLIFQEVWRGE